MKSSPYCLLLAAIRVSQGRAASERGGRRPHHGSDSRRAPPSAAAINRSETRHRRQRAAHLRMADGAQSRCARTRNEGALLVRRPAYAIPFLPPREGGLRVITGLWPAELRRYPSHRLHMACAARISSWYTFPQPRRSSSRHLQRVYDGSPHREHGRTPPLLVIAIQRVHSLPGNLRRRSWGRARALIRRAGPPCRPAPAAARDAQWRSGATHAA